MPNNATTVLSVANVMDFFFPKMTPIDYLEKGKIVTGDHYIALLDF